jgi:hypothetical protein
MNSRRVTEYPQAHGRQRTRRVLGHFRAGAASAGGLAERRGLVPLRWRALGLRCSLEQRGCVAF